MFYLCLNFESSDITCRNLKILNNENYIKFKQTSLCRFTSVFSFFPKPMKYQSGEGSDAYSNLHWSFNVHIYVVSRSGPFFPFFFFVLCCYFLVKCIVHVLHLTMFR